MANKDSNLAKLYLFAYNLLQFIGWSYVLAVVLLHVLRKGHFRDVYTEVQISLSIFQTLQLLEVVHCMVGLVPSNPVQTLMQVTSRLFVVWCVLLPISESRDSVGVPILSIAWSVAEMTRYIYYALHIYKLVPYVLLWMRYTFFIVLYPLGLSGELLTMVCAYPYFRDRNLFAFPLPNFLNVSFYYHILLIIIMLSYIPFFLQLYFYMIGQRKKALGAGLFNSCQKTKLSRNYLKHHEQTMNDPFIVESNCDTQL